MKNIINSKQLLELQFELQNHKIDFDKFHKHYKIKHLHEMATNDFDKALIMIKKKPLKDWEEKNAFLNTKKLAHDKINYHLNRIYDTVLGKTLGTNNG